ncbi:MAG: YicC/YloC family endoribonuclease [Pseudomonadota bacterium]|nr:YicC/YloC family endoribonuclease [Pseudomonadota bacterium]
MLVSSMTGFARVDRSEAGYSWVWEARSVNSKSLDLRFRLPHGFDHIEAIARKAADAHFARGNFSISLSVQRSENQPTLQVNQEVLNQLIAVAAQYRSSPEEVNVEMLLSLKGVIDVVEDKDEDPQVVVARDAAITETFNVLMERLGSARREEGARLKKIAEEHIAKIWTLTNGAANIAEMHPTRRKERMITQIADVLAGDGTVSEDRMAQEIAMIVARGDVQEELDRLLAHVEAARGLLAEGRVIGRRLDFLCQEFNREANTLCSKSSDLELTQAGLALKAVIERLREQIQNIE